LQSSALIYPRYLHHDHYRRPWLVRYFDHNSSIGKTVKISTQLTTTGVNGPGFPALLTITSTGQKYHPLRTLEALYPPGI
jgi:hypothetical protein